MKSDIEELAQSSAHIERMSGDAPDTAVIEEIGNILAGVYLTAIHDFCNLNIYHTIPSTAQDMAQAVMDETIARMGVNSRMLVVIVNKFSSALQNQKTIETFLILVPDKDSEKPLLDSIQGAKKLHGR